MRKYRRTEKFKEWQRNYLEINRAKRKTYMAGYNVRTRGRRMGLSPGDYDAMFHNQSGVCDVCGAPERRRGRSLAVDHNHATGVVRALLCHDCNIALGLLREQPEIARSLADYMEHHQNRPVSRKYLKVAGTPTV